MRLRECLSQRHRARRLDLEHRCRCDRQSPKQNKVDFTPSRTRTAARRSRHSNPRDRARTDAKGRWTAGSSLPALAVRRRRPAVETVPAADIPILNLSSHRDTPRERGTPKRAPLGSIISISMSEHSCKKFERKDGMYDRTPRSPFPCSVVQVRARAVLANFVTAHADQRRLGI